MPHSDPIAPVLLAIPVNELAAVGALSFSEVLFDKDLSIYE